MPAGAGMSGGSSNRLQGRSGASRADDYGNIHGANKGDKH